MKYFYRLVVALVFAVVTALLSGCTGGGGGYSSVYGGYGYPRYGHDIGYNSMYYDRDNLDQRYRRVEDRRAYRAERVRNINPEQRQQAQRRLQQTRPQRVERRATRPARNMGRPRGRVRRR